MMSYPKKIETVHVETLDGELCIYDTKRMEVHSLNPTAAAVWQLCNGETTPQQMAQQFKGDLDSSQAEELVWLTLKRLEKAHLLEKEAVDPAGRKVYTRREMLAKLGIAAVMLPVVSSIVAPRPVAAQSNVPMNLALGSVATASSLEFPAVIANNVTDGDLATRWASATGAQPEWIYVDLGTVQNFSRVVLHWEAAYGVKYQIQASNDAATWTDIVVETSGDGGTDDHSFPLTSARYVRMYGTERINNTWGFSLFEFEVWG